MSLGAFFEAIGPFLRGETDTDEVERRLGPSSCPPEDLRFYAELVAFDQHRILGELMPAVRGWISRSGGDWPATVRAFVADHPPTGWSVPHVGERFADWLAARRATDPGLPPGIDAVADLAWTRFQLRNAPDGPAIEVRHYPIDAVGVTRALVAGDGPDPGAPGTLVLYRHLDDLRVRSFSPSLATIGVLHVEGGGVLVGPLATLTPEGLAAERVALVARGVLAAV